MKPIRVLHIITQINRGGAENHLCELVEASIARGVEIKVVYLKGDGYWADRLLQAGASVYSLNLKYYGQVAPLLNLRSIIATDAPDIVHAHLQPAELYSRLALLGCGYQPRFVISKHNDEPFWPYPASGFFGRWVAKRASCLIAISEAVRNYFISNLTVPLEKIKTIHYGLPVVPFDDVDACINLHQEFRKGSGGLLIGTVARLVPQKALHVLINGFARYQKFTGCPGRLVIVGEGPLRSELEQLAQDLGVADDVIFAGFREDIPRVMCAFDVFVLTSIYEGFGLVLLEAMAARRPIIATKVSAIPEVVCDGETGILIPPLSPDSVAESLMKMESSSLRETYGVAGAQRLNQNFSVGPMVGKTLDIYRKSLNLL